MKPIFPEIRYILFLRHRLIDVVDCVMHKDLEEAEADAKKRMKELIRGTKETRILDFKITPVAVFFEAREDNR